MNKIKGVAAVFGVAVLMVVGLACGNGAEPRPTETNAASDAPQAEDQLTTGPSSGPVSAGSMVPRHNSVEELVKRSHVIVLGTIDLVLEEKRVGPYGQDGQPIPAGEDAMPVTDYQVNIESVLKSDDAIAGADSLVLRMFGHLSNKAVVVTLNLFALPEPGDHLLFALGRNPDGTYGSGPEGLLKVDGEKVAYNDDVPFADEMSPDEFMQDIRAAASASGTNAPPEDHFQQDEQKTSTLEIDGYGYTVGDVVQTETGRPALGQVIIYDPYKNQSICLGMGPAMSLGKIVGVPGETFTFQNNGIVIRAEMIELNRDHSHQSAVFGGQKYGTLAEKAITLKDGEYLMDTFVGLECFREELTEAGYSVPYNRFTVNEEAIIGIIVGKIAHDKEAEEKFRNLAY